MAFWNFIHNSMNLHIYTFLSLIVLAAMITIGVVHVIASKKREEDNGKNQKESERTDK